MVNAWQAGRVPGVPIYPPLGAFMSRRKLASSAYVLPQWARIALDGAHLYWAVFPELTLGASQSGLTRLTIAEDFWVLAVFSRASVAGTSAGSFRALIYEEQGAYKWSKTKLNQLGSTQIAQQPGSRRLPHFIAAGSPMNCEVQNLATAANVVDLALYGVSGWWRGINADLPPLQPWRNPDKGLVVYG